MRQLIELSGGAQVVETEGGDLVVTDGGSEVMLDRQDRAELLEQLLPAWKRQRERNAFLLGAEAAAERVLGRSLTQDEALDLYERAMRLFPQTAERRRVLELRPGVVATTDLDGQVRVTLSGEARMAMAPGDPMKAQLAFTREDLGLLRDLAEHPTEARAMD